MKAKKLNAPSTKHAAKDTTKDNTRLNKLLPLKHETLILPQAKKVKLHSYAEILLNENSVQNLVSRRIKTAQEFFKAHIDDALLALPIFKQQLALLKKKRVKNTDPLILKIADIGSGNGIPGIPLAIMFPDVSFLLIERSLKRAAFLVALKEKLQLQNVEVLNKNLQEIRLGTSPSSALFKKPDIITARAFASTEKILQDTKLMSSSDTCFLLYKGRETVLTKELTLAKKSEKREFSAYVHRLHRQSQTEPERHLLEIHFC